MKMSKVDYTRLELSINELLALYPDAIAKMRVKGWNDTMIRWEFYDRADITIKNDLYRYCSDDNIDTALRKIIPLSS